MSKVYLQDITLPTEEWGDKTYSFVQTDADLDTAGDAADAKAVGDELTNLKQDYNQLSETKADKNSDNPNMGAGYASQLVSSLRKSDSVPYNFRKVPYDATLEDGSIVGASVAWNQLIEDPHTSHSLNRDSSRTYYLSTNYISCVIGHRYFLSATITEDTTTLGVTFEYGGGTSLNFKGTGRHSAILKQATSVASSVYTGIPMSEASGTKATYTDVLLTDLTQMLGTTIADYVYSLETATAGSGVAWLKEHFPKQFGGGYQAYNTGEIKSISGLTAHKSIGFNQFDGEWITDTDYYVAKNYMSVIPGKTYYIYAPNIPSGERIYANTYDSNKTLVGSNVSIGRVGAYVIPDGVCYMKLRCWGTFDNSDLCFNISKPTGTPKNGDYVAYEEHTYALDSTQTLRGILKLDSNNKLYADGDRYLSDGTVQRRFGVVDLGTLTWSYNSTAQVFYTSIPTKKWGKSNYIISKYITTDKYYGDLISGESCGAEYDVYVNIKDTAYTDAASFKTAMSGVYLIYELATPTTETASPYGNPQFINPDGTESYVYTDGSFELPVGHESEYPVNVSGQLDDILDTPTTNGTYTLQATVADGKVSYEWVSTT